MSVHNTHCCKVHGCKYGDDDCPVVLGTENGIICEACMTAAAGFALLKSHAVTIFKSGNEVTIVTGTDEEAMAVFEWLDTVAGETK